MPDAAAPLPYADPTTTADVPRQLATAHLAWRPVQRAVRYATFDAWTLAICAALSLPCAIGGVVGVLLAVVLGATAYVEFTAVRRLRRLDPAALRRLAVNQLVLGGALVLYAAWNLILVADGRGMLAELNAHQGDLGDMGPQAGDLFKTFLYVLYGALAVIGGCVTGGTAWFYASRSAHLSAYLSNTPPWIVQMQRERGTL